MQEAGFRSVFEHSNDAILIFDPDADEILAANPQAADLLEYSQSELESLRPRAIHPDEVDAFEAFVDTVYADGSGWTSSLSCLTKSGRSVPAEISATTFDHDGRDVVLASIRDVSDREEHAAILDDLASTAATLIRLEDRTAIAEHAVAAAERTLDLELSHVYLRTEDGGTPRLEPAAVTDTFAREFGDPPAFERPEGLLWSTLGTGKPRVFDDVRAEVGDEMATDLPFRNALLFPLGDHGVFGIASTEHREFDEFHYDVAEVLATQVHAALDNAAHLRELEAKNDRLDEFASTVSHDLRNPLTVAQGHLEFLKATRDDDHVHAIEESLDRMESLIDDILTTAQADHADVDLSVVSLSAFVAECWKHVAAGNATVEVAEDAALCADEHLFKQLLENLFRNAAEHGRADTGNDEDLEITVGALHDGFYVADDGVGIPESERTRVLEAGYSEDETGTGLGLKIVTRIANAHGWSLTVTDSDAGGARFEFTDVELV